MVWRLLRILSSFNLEARLVLVQVVALYVTGRESVKHNTLLTTHFSSLFEINNFCLVIEKTLYFFFILRFFGVLNEPVIISSER